MSRASGVDDTTSTGHAALRRWTPSEREHLELLAKALVETCVRNTQLEEFHAGKVPQSLTGDYSDVRVVTPGGDIPWTELSRISDSEMRSLMIEIVDRVFTFLQYPDELSRLGAAKGWNRPRLDPALMRTVHRRLGLPVDVEAIGSDRQPEE